MTEETHGHVAPQAVADAAAKGLDLRRQFRRGGTEIGVARARDLKNRRALSDDTIMRMSSYFSRHKVDKRAANFGNDDDPSPGYVAWLLWGGEPGQKWAEAQKKRLKESRTPQG